MADDGRVSPIGKRQQNAAQNPQPTPAKDPALQPDDGSVNYTAADERRFYAEYRERMQRRRQPQDR